jgi:hypothetical protein
LAGAPAGATVLITVNKSTQQMAVEVDGALRWTWPVSTGQLGYDTPSGRYTAFRMEADHFSREWDDAPMPHSIFFTQQGHAIHGYLNTRNIGTPASHGCVRLAPENAAKLYALVEQQGLPNTKVVLTGDVRTALIRRGLPQGRDSNENIATGEPLGVRSNGPYEPRYGEPAGARQYGYEPRNGERAGPRPYGYGQRYYDHQSPSGYPATPYGQASPAYPGYPNYPPRYPSAYSGYSYRPFGN